MKIKTRKHNIIMRIIPWVTAALLIAVLVGVGNWYYSTTKSHKIGEKTYLYSMGTKVEYSKDAKLIRKSGITNIVEDDTIESDGTPLVSAEEPKFFLPVSMAYLSPNSEQGVKRVNYFSTLTLEEDGIKLNYSDNTKTLTNGFMYDGNGTFVFMEKMTIKVDQKTYDVAPMTYAKYYYHNSLELYDCENETYQFIALTESNVEAESKQGYSVNLGTCVLKSGSEQRILFTDIDAMGVME